MQFDVWYDLTLRDLSGDDTVSALVHEADAAAQPAADDDAEEDQTAA